MATTLRPLGWIPDLPDQRDFVYAAPAPIVAALPARVDLRADCPPVVSQGDLGSCTANAIASAHLFIQSKMGLEARFYPSRLFIYYNERAIMGTITSDSGAMLRDGMKSIARLGACSEDLWPYIESKFARRPSAGAYVTALAHRAISYRRILPDLLQMRGCLASGFPFVFGFMMYESFLWPDVETTGVVQMPAYDERALGGHAVLAVGYDDTEEMIIIMNSWGPEWGDHGFCYLPYAYVLNTNLADDFWTIRMVE